MPSISIAPPEPIAIEQALPPVVRILSPRDEASLPGDAVIVRIAVRTPANAPVTAVKVLIDGRPATAARGLDLSSAASQSIAESQPIAADEVTREIEVVLPRQNCELSVIVENRNAASVPARIRVLRPNQLPANPTGKLYVLAVGVSRYSNMPDKRLAYPAIDAQAFVKAVARQKGSLYQDVVVKLLTDETATRDAVEDGLDWIEKNTTRNDVAMVFFSGHGANDDNQVYHFLPYNFDPQRWKATGIPSNEIEETLQSIHGRVLLFLDTCNSGNVDLTAVVNTLASPEHGIAVFCASGRAQAALEDPAWGNGAFTKALIEGLTSESDQTIPLNDDSEVDLDGIRKSKKITFNRLQQYVSDRVKELTGQRQEPTFGLPAMISNTLIAVVPTPLR